MFSSCIWAICWAMASNRFCIVGPISHERPHSSFISLIPSIPAPATILLVKGPLYSGHHGFGCCGSESGNGQGSWISSLRSLNVSQLRLNPMSLFSIQTSLFQDGECIEVRFDAYLLTGGSGMYSRVYAVAG